MTDSEIARDALRDDQSLVVVKNGTVVLTRTGRGIRPLYETATVPKNEGVLGGAALADKVIGKAAALLCVHGGVKSVYAILMSEPAVAVLTANGIPFEYRQIVPLVLNRTRTDTCPVEKLVNRLETPAEAITAITEFLRQLE